MAKKPPAKSANLIRSKASQSGGRSWAAQAQNGKSVGRAELGGSGAKWQVSRAEMGVLAGENWRSMEKNRLGGSGATNMTKRCLGK